MASSELVILRDGQVASLDALRLGWALEARGFTMRLAGDRLHVQPHQRLTTGDVEAIRRHRDELLALVGYEPRST